ncbi:MAG: hypothetical protein DMG06_20235 [Acidobacteria bacterium]|nr:MAG: hypothetical protein DMG06_20235 [Acidobacteriota bacterium]
MKAVFFDGQLKIDPTKLLHRTLPLERALEAFELARQPGVPKVLLQPSSHQQSRFMGCVPS